MRWWPFRKRKEEPSVDDEDGPDPLRKHQGSPDARRCGVCGRTKVMRLVLRVDSLEPKTGVLYCVACDHINRRNEV